MENPVNADPRGGKARKINSIPKKEGENERKLGVQIKRKE
jgi:hypothetical protein